MPILGVVIIMIGMTLIYLGFTGSTIGELVRSVFGP